DLSGRRRYLRGDLSETHPARFAQQLRATGHRTCVRSAAPDVHHLRSELGREPLGACVAGRELALLAIAADLALLETFLRAVEGDPTVSLLHLVTELDVKVRPAHAARLLNPSHRHAPSARRSAPPRRTTISTPRSLWPTFLLRGWARWPTPYAPNFCSG